MRSALPLVGLAALVVGLHYAMAASATVCTPHGTASDGSRITLCLTKLDPTHCRLIFKVLHPDGSKSKVGGVVRCGGQRSKSDPGDRRPL